MRKLFMLCAAVLCALNVYAVAPITISVSPRIVARYQTIVLTIHIERVPENRLLQWTCDGADWYASSEIQLEGDNSQATWSIEKAFHGIPPGEYACAARLIRTDNTPSIVHTTFVVN